MVFETLGVSLYDLVKMNDFRRLPLWCVRDVARQMLEGIDFLSSINLIHTGESDWNDFVIFWVYSNFFCVEYRFENGKRSFHASVPAARAR